MSSRAPRSGRARLAAEARVPRGSAPRGFPVVCTFKGVGLRGDLDRPPHRDKRAAVPIAEEVDRGTVQVSGGILERPDDLPALPHAKEGFLDDVFRLLPTAGHHEQQLEQPDALDFEELLERARLGIHRLRGSVPRAPEPGYLRHTSGRTSDFVVLCRGQVIEKVTREEPTETRGGERVSQQGSRQATRTR